MNALNFTKSYSLEDLSDLIIDIKTNPNKYSLDMIQEIHSYVEALQTVSAMEKNPKYKI